MQWAPSHFILYANLKSKTSTLKKNHSKNMTSLETKQKLVSQESFIFLDCLYCEEKCCDEVDDNGFGSSNLSPLLLHDSSSFYSEDEEEMQLNDLFLKEEKIHFSKGSDLDANMLVLEARREALEWMIRVNYHHNFSANTLALGANYFDRFMLRFGFKKDIPWMTHVVAVACLSLASKIEETHVPLLLDFQVECKQIFEPKVIQRMELLVLSTLEWRMNAVTPLSYFGHLIKKLKLKIDFHWEILCRCESITLSAILDPRYLCYVPSVIAAATMMQTLKEIGPCNTLEHYNDIIDGLKLDQDKLEDCYKFIQDLSNNDKSHKRKCYNTSPSKSPNNVLDMVSSDISFSKDSSSIISSMKSPEPLTKKCRTIGPPSFG